MVIFPMRVVLRGFLPSTYSKYASDKNPCAAYLIKKIPHFSYYLKREYTFLYPGDIFATAA